MLYGVCLANSESFVASKDERPGIMMASWQLYSNTNWRSKWKCGSDRGKPCPYECRLENGHEYMGF